MGRHSAPPARRRAAGVPTPGRARWIAIATVAVLLVAATIALVTLPDDTDLAAFSPPSTTTASPGCDDSLDPVALVVAVAPAAVAAVEALGERLAADGTGVEGRCIEVSVQARAADQVATTLAAADSGEVPDVWVSDSRVWVQRAKTTPAGSLRLVGTTSTLAQTPLVLAMPRADAEEVGWPDGVPAWADWLSPDERTPPVSIPDPTTSTAGLGLLMTADSVLGESVEGRRAMVAFLRTAAGSTAAGGEDASTGPFPTSEQAVVTHNATTPDQPLVAVYPGDAQLPLEITFSTVHQADADDGQADRLRAAQQLLQLALSDAGQEIVGTFGFRQADGSATGAVTERAGASPDQVGVMTIDAATAANRALGAYQTARLDAQILSVLDVSGSMVERLPDGRTRLDLASAAIDYAMQLLPDTSNAGLWTFSTRLRGDADFVELVPLGQLGESLAGTRRRDRIAGALDAAVPTRDTALYDTTLAAYRTVQAAYDPNKINSVVVLTDGENDDDTTISLDQLLAELEAAADPERPVQLIFVAVGLSVDQAVLQRIAAVPGGAVYVADEPADLGQVYLDAIVRSAQGVG